MALNENIKKFRKDAELTQKELARKSGLSFSMVSKLESGEQANPSFETIRKIADVLRISPGELVNAPPSIEDQIDEYIEYKKGLKKGCQKSADIKADAVADHEEPILDLNFKKKLFAINNIPISLDYYREEIPDYPVVPPEMRRLYSALKNATKDEINQVIRLLETVKKY